MEVLQQKTKLTHVALHAKPYTRALCVTFATRAALQPTRLAAYGAILVCLWPLRLDRGVHESKQVRQPG